MTFPKPGRVSEAVRLWRAPDEVLGEPGAIRDSIWFMRRRQQFVDALPLPTAILCEDDHGRGFVECANPLFHALAGNADPDQALDSLGVFCGFPIRDRLNAFAEKSEESCTFDLNVKRRGESEHYQVQLSKMPDEPHRPRRVVLSLIDCTARVETERHLRTQMLRDGLTGLLNRPAFNDRIAARLGEADTVAHAVIVIDLTRFSRVNESIGAVAGDLLLAAFATRLLSVIGPDDIVARIGGDEFGVFLDAASGMDDVLAFTARVGEALAEPFRLGNLDIHVGCAVGAALLTRADEVAEEMVRNAQFALRRAKATGQPQLYQPDEANAARRRFAMETALRRAIEAGQLDLHFQPVIDFASGRVAGFEALARWEHDEWGPVPASEFIAVAEESGLVLPLGRWALEQAVATLAAWDRKMGRVLPIYMAVNLSAIQIQRDDVPALVAEVLARHGIEGRRLLLEVTESAIIHDPEAVSKVLNAMRDLDVRIALDDFGTGYTSLAYLQRLPIDMLKMDRRFVTGMLDDPDATAIVRAILSLAGSMRMVTTAEGIENEELSRTLRALGCTKGQGYHFAPPLWPDAALSYFVSRSS